MNRVYISGNLGRDPETRALTSGTMVASLAVAVNGGYKDKTGAWIERTTWLDCEAWGKTAERCRELTKGTSVVIEGELERQEWEDKASGAKRSKVIVRVTSIAALAQRQQGQDSESAPAPASAPPPPPRAASSPPRAPAAQGAPADDIPF
jgi:single-strand DNA-binding protein